MRIARHLDVPTGSTSPPYLMLNVCSSFGAVSSSVSVVFMLLKCALGLHMTNSKLSPKPLNLPHSIACENGVTEGATTSLAMVCKRLSWQL
jgi:hypothetical protein